LLRTCTVILLPLEDFSQKNFFKEEKKQQLLPTPT